ncbi:hypothetical protein AURDEDRAFT_116504 [Auricularia subglabra TFB-10046 SS5]|nr:hypothetical protein AURDEDRAFT_116504 [Auricularia subglabra TFB-10046 SS5]
MRLHQLEIAHILDPCYHISPASPCPSVLSAQSATTWRDDTGKHDPDFRPFPASRSPSSSSCYSPRSSFDLPIVPASPPSKAERRAARRDLDPVLREAVRAHERQLAKERRQSWLSRRKPRFDEEAGLDGVADIPVFEDEDAPAETPYVCRKQWLLPCSLRRRKRVPRRDRIRLQLASLSLRVDLAVFRAKKRLRTRFGLS